MLDKAVADRIVLDYKVQFGHFVIVNIFIFQHTRTRSRNVLVLSVLFLFYLQDIFKQATEDRLTSAKELPYFEGDFWPNVLEESIKELEQEEEERKREENSTSNESVDVSL